MILKERERVETDSPDSSLSRVKSSGSPPMNTPVFSPIMVLPLEADALPGGGCSSTGKQRGRVQSD